MESNTLLTFIKNVLRNKPSNWTRLTTHRLDIYTEKLAKVEFLEQFENLYLANDFSAHTLNELPTAYDYIRLGHPLSCVLEWTIAKLNGLKPEHVISFQSDTVPVMAILRKNLLSNTKTRIVYTDELPTVFDAETIKRVYGYEFELQHVNSLEEVSAFDGSTVLVTQKDKIESVEFAKNIDFIVNIHSNLGSVLIANNEQDESYVSEIQHVRRRETVSMTPANCLIALEEIVGESSGEKSYHVTADKKLVAETIQQINDVNTKALVGSSGLSIQYAIMMGLIDDALENHPEKAIKFIVPTNCYGGTNDQARRVAACLENVEIVDLLVDGDNDMVKSLNTVLDHIASEDAIPYIIAEIPTNPRVEVPDLQALKETLHKKRTTASGETAIEPVFILDQTFCPNVHFLGEGKTLSTVRAISYSSGSKFPSGGLCTAGYCIGNEKAASLLEKIEKHLTLCDNEATPLQYEILAQQMPSMIQRIADAYTNTRAFVNFIEEVLPAAKINFVSEELAAEGFTPSVFSLDLPTKGATEEERETYKRKLNHKLIHKMITEIPDESKYCVSYGQLQGCYWTIPATSTQGTTKEGDKDYIARVALSPNMDLELHKQVFADFVKEEI
ncbi:Cys/Met metabolism PLP-dependent enzyme [Kordia periserrulae]|uniref:Cys/Met metabolism PLP-dependent enzyme n=1 Tax=Kordia periserrulae TaxID=701523 RepID=A0A2T6BX67_9FLAO|nr:PLP-dependent transferase [Kordia periserrulae]PTX60672.1 Cys/Met metabolism PLP-dependent enzyme [Kordia periserrulae]